MEFVSSVLVVADQFLLTRLKQICECQLSRLLTLKNAAELLQFSVYYLAEQVRETHPMSNFFSDLVPKYVFFSNIKPLVSSCN